MMFYTNETQKQFHTCFQGEQTIDDYSIRIQLLQHPFVYFITMKVFM